MTQENVTITLNKTVTVARDADVCVVYMGTVGEAESVHTAPFGVEAPGLDWLMLEPGGSMVNAGLLADHVAKPHPAFKRAIEAGAFTIYATPDEALAAPMATVTAMVRITRQARTLRAWLAVEEKREPKRRVLLEGLRERLRINAEHSTPTTSIIPLQAKPTEPVQGRHRKAS